MFSGIGPVRRKELRQFCGSVEKIKEATGEELSQAPKMNRKAAQTIYNLFHPPEQKGPVLPGFST